ncbi:hypothetical protein FYK55_14660 [Roseiconus nitratireducens]|uniref:Phospholipase C/D domain-containing protein n=1 Tax=Roseiconus nitratireducens TaxID=2605748 RepID=A0A5M6D5H0_9BACT|nr:zinc dependent phospholipase C family protein [Roseiconus nitratireducens]KAA5542758.1 hypothetical protein FYK55_14660 [Roseiconus nitratireducens]
MSRPTPAFRTSTLHRIVRRTRCVQTHQRFAIDALPLVATAGGTRLASWLLVHHAQYLRGAIDPDIRFRDYHNHVIHVREGCWGAAPRVARHWYFRLQQHLRSQNFAQAAYSAGVLSHYFTDVFQPLHTACSERENLVHGPLEWSIEQAYDQILGCWQTDPSRMVMPTIHQTDWLTGMMLHGAKRAGQHFDLLSERYRLLRVFENPTAGLDPVSLRVLAELFGLAISGWARILERAAGDAEANLRRPLPSCGHRITLAGTIAGCPIHLLKNRVAYWRRRRLIRAVTDEYLRTGHLDRCLPAEVDIKRRVIAVYRDEQQRKAKLRQDANARRILDASIGPQHLGQHDTVASSERPAAPARRTEGGLSKKDSIRCLSSLGPAIARRLETIGVNTIGDFLQCPSRKLADHLATGWIDKRWLRQRQMEANLRCEISGLSCSEAAWLAEIEIADTLQLADADAFDLDHRIRQRLANPDQPWLRQVAPPSPDRLESLIAIARRSTACQPPNASRPPRAA